MTSNLELEPCIHGNLVPDVYAQIFKYCSLKDLKSLSSCSSSFNQQVAVLMWKEVCIPAEVLDEKNVQDSTTLSKLMYTKTLRLADVPIFHGQSLVNYNSILDHCDPNIVKTFIRQGENAVSPFVFKTTFEKLPNLEQVAISGETISMAAFSSVEMLKNIRSLDLSSTCVSDETLQIICNSLHTLHFLNLSATKVTGDSLSLLQKLPRLSVLRLSRCEIMDVGASHIAKCKHLTALDVSQCYLSDAGLEALAKLTDLIALEATQKQMHSQPSQPFSDPWYYDEGVLHLLRLKKLQELAIGQAGGSQRSRLTVDSISKLSALEHLTSLSIRFSRLDHHCLRSLSSLQELVLLDMQNCQGVDDRGIQYLPSLTRLQKLKVTGCFTNLSLYYISQLSLLSHLTFHDNIDPLEDISRDQPGVNEAGIVHLTALSHLQTLEIYADLTSRGFEAIGEITSLLKLDVSFMALNYDAFMYFSRLTNLRSFKCGGYRLEDPTDEQPVPEEDEDLLQGPLEPEDEVVLDAEDLPNNPRHDEYLALQNADNPWEINADDWSQLLSQARERAEQAEQARHMKALQLERMQRMPTNECMYHIGNMSSLEYLDINGAPVTNNCLPHLRRLINLKELSCYDTGLTPEALKELNVKAKF